MSFVGTGESTEVAGADDMDGKLEHVEERARWKASRRLHQIAK
jgi:hypothetical protein